MNKVEKIINQILDNPGAAAHDLLVNRLLEQFQSGAPLEYLRPLLLSDDPQIASSAAWIASELGSEGQPLLDVVVDLLDHPDKRVRFWVTDCILLWADSASGKAVARVIALLDDPEKAVRWKAMGFVRRAAKDQLEAALDWFSANEPESPQVSGLRWFLSDTAQDAAAVEKMIQHPVTEMRKYGAVAAAKIASRDRHPLTVAASSEDEDIVDFASDSLEALSVS